MLDNTEPNEPTNEAAGSERAPVKRAPAKRAPAKRAPRKAAAKKVAGPDQPAGAEPSAADPTTAGPTTAEPIAAEPATSVPSEILPLGTGLSAEPDDPQASETPAKKAGRAAAKSTAKAVKKAPAKKAPAKKAPAKKAPARKASKKAAPPAEREPTASSGDLALVLPELPVIELPATDQSGADQSGADQSTADQPAAAQAPAKKAARKRVSKKAAAEAAAEAERADAAKAGQSDTDEDAQDGTATVPMLAAPTVLFQAPAESTAPPTRRRRSSRAAQVEPDAPPTAVQIDGQQAEEQPAVEPVQSEDPESEDDAGTDGGTADGSRRRRRRGRRGRGSRSGEASADATETSDSAEAAEAEAGEESETDHADEVAEAALSASARRRRRRRRSSGADGEAAGGAEDDPPNTVVHVRDSRSGGSNRGGAADDDGVRGVKGSTRLEAKRQRRRDNRDSGRRRAPILTEAEFLARREAVDRVMAVRQTGDRTQIAVLEDDILVEHYVTRASSASAVGNVYLGRVQNVLPSMEAAFIDIGRGRNGVLYAGEVNWDMAGLEGKARSIENALSSGDTVLVQVTKDPIGHKGARLTSQISLPGRFVVYVPGGGMTGISRKLPDTERSRLKSILKKVVPDEAGVIVRTAAEGASEQDLINDVERLKQEWESISKKAAKKSDGPQLVHGEPDLAIRVVRDIFNDDFSKLIVSGSGIHRTLADYVGDIAPDLVDRISLHTAETDLFRDLRVDEQLSKALDRKVWLPSGGSLVIDRTEAMTVVDVNTGKYTGSGGNLEQTVTRNNLEAAEEIVRQLRLRDLGGIVVIDFIDMVLESNRELVLRRLTECLGRDRTKHQVAEVTSLGLVQMTRKRVGEGLLEAFSEPCQHCNGRGVIVHLEPVERKSAGLNATAEDERPARGKRTRKPKAEAASQPDAAAVEAENTKRRAAASAIAAIAAATAHHDEPHLDEHPVDEHRGPDAGPAAVDTAASAALDTAPSEPAPSESAQSDSVASVRVASGGRVVSGQPASDRAASAQAVSGSAQTDHDGATEPAGATAPNGSAPRPRRRRAASRPAGPPTPVEANTAD